MTAPLYEEVLLDYVLDEGDEKRTLSLLAEDEEALSYAYQLFIDLPAIAASMGLSEAEAAPLVDRAESRLRAILDRAADEAATFEDEKPAAEPEPAPEETGGAEVIPFPARFTTRAFVPLLAAAAAIVIFVALPDEPVTKGVGDIAAVTVAVEDAGGLEALELERVLAKRLEAIQACGTEPGTRELSITIDDAGLLTDVQSPDAKYRGCMQAALDRLPWPIPDAATPVKLRFEYREK